MSNPRKHVWVLMVNGVQIGVWPFGRMACIRLPADVSDGIKTYLGKIVQGWLQSAHSEMERMKGSK